MAKVSINSNDAFTDVLTLTYEDLARIKAGEPFPIATLKPGMAVELINAYVSEPFAGTTATFEVSDDSAPSNPSLIAPVELNTPFNVVNTGGAFDSGGSGGNSYFTKVGTAYIGGDQTGQTRDNEALDVQAGRFSAEQVASGPRSTAVGHSNRADGPADTAVGYNNRADGENSTAVGYSNTAIGYYSTAVGYSNIASALNATAFGYSNQADGDNSTAVGYANFVTRPYSSAFGYYNNGDGNGVLVIGFNNYALDDYASAVGYNNTVNGKFSSAFGHSNQADGNYASAVGNSNQADGNYASAVGNSNTTDGNYAFAVGNSNTAEDNYASAVGYLNLASSPQSTAVGHQNTASGDYSVAIGHMCKTTINQTLEAGIWINPTTRTSGIRAHPNGQIALTIENSGTAPTDGGATAGSEPDGSLPRSMYAIQKNGNNVTLYYNNAGTIQRLSLGNLT